MNIPGISSGDASLGALDPFGGSRELGRDAFLQLLVTQIKSQDPLEPIANEDFIAQLATFSSLEQLEGLNDNLVAMITLQQGNALLAQLTQGGALIGQEVRWDDPFTGETGRGTVDSVKVQGGIAVLSVGGEDVPLASVVEVLGAGGETKADEASA
jgi:flagellar basal-body rod modification protein FlgD